MSRGNVVPDFRDNPLPGAAARLSRMIDDLRTEMNSGDSGLSEIIDAATALLDASILRISANESSISDIESDLSTVSSTVSAHTESISTIEGDIEDLQEYPQSGYVSGRGWWTKFADGTLIQRGDKQSSSSSSSAIRSYSVTFPIPFFDTNYHVSHCEKTSINGYSFSPDFCKSSPSITGVSLHTIEVNTNTTTGYGNISWTAIGRWKA